MSYFQKFVAFIVLLAVQPSLVAQDPIQRIAFLAGVTNYKDKDFGNLDYPENDVRAIEIE